MNTIIVVSHPFKNTTSVMDLIPTYVDKCPKLLDNADSLTSLHLHISNYRAALPTLQALARSTHLKEAWLETSEADEGVGLLCRDTLCPNSSLERLRLDLRECSDEGIRDVAKVISTSNSKLRQISLSLNNVGEKGAGHLAQALRLSPFLTEFSVYATQLDLHDKCIGDKGVALICDAAMTDVCCPLTSLSIAQSRVTISGLECIMKLLNYNHCISKLDLHSNLLNSQAAELLASHLSSEHCQVTSLILDGNSRIGDTGTKAIALSLCTNRSLELLSLRSCGIGKRGAERFATTLSENETLRELVLCGNVEVGNDAIELLSRGLCVNASLVKLDLSSCGIGDMGCASLATALGENQTLQSLLLHKNEISTGGIVALSQVLASSTSS